MTMCRLFRRRSSKISSLADISRRPHPRAGPDDFATSTWWRAAAHEAESSHRRNFSFCVRPPNAMVLAVTKGNPMAFRPNYRQQRSERDRQARAKQAEKLKKLQEKSQARKAERDGTPPPPEEDQE